MPIHNPSGRPSYPYRHRWVRTAPSVRLHVVEAGPPHGERVVLLHGFPEFWYGWRHQIPALARAGYRVIVPDQRGYHRSSKPRRIQAYGIRHLVRDVRALIDATGGAPAHVVGHDWGAMVAWALAARAPQYVRRLGILNVPHPHVMRETLRTDPAQRIRSLYAAFFQLPYLPEWVLRARHGAGLALLMRLSSHPSTFPAAALRRYRVAWRQPGAVRSMLHWYRAALRTNDLRALPNTPIQPPTLVLWGAKDTALRAHMAPKSVARCANGRLMMLPEATHWVQHDCPDRVNQTLGAFLEA